jgi:hypothetical protein
MLNEKVRTADGRSLYTLRGLIGRDRVPMFLVDLWQPDNLEICT